jgi:hypothetical protein
MNAFFSFYFGIRDKADSDPDPDFDRHDMTGGSSSLI